MNPKKCSVVTRGPWNCGGMSGHGITGYIMQPFRMREGFNPTATDRTTFRIQHGQLYGLNLQGTYDEIRAEAKRLELLYGYAQYYSRNLCSLVMSGRMRKAGKGTTEGMYNRAVEEGKRKRCPKLTFHSVWSGNEFFSIYTAHTATGDYHLTPVFHERNCVGYTVRFANTKGKLLVGLWNDLGEFAGLKEARKACQKFERDHC